MEQVDGGVLAERIESKSSRASTGHAFDMSIPLPERASSIASSFDAGSERSKTDGSPSLLPSHIAEDDLVDQLLDRGQIVGVDLPVIGRHPELAHVQCASRRVARERC